MQPKQIMLALILVLSFLFSASAQGTRLLRQPSLSNTRIAFTYGGDIWVSNLDGSQVIRITSTASVEKDPQISPDGKLIAFTSNRFGSDAIYIVSIDGGTPIRLTWHPSQSRARGWTLDGKRIIYSSTRQTAPAKYDRLWTVSLEGGPSKLLTYQWATNGSFAPDSDRIIIDRVRRWDSEWRGYRGGQNTPLVILNLKDLTESMLPNESTTDIQPVWMGESIYFLSDRDWTANIWSYSPKNGELIQITNFTGSDIKGLDGHDNKLVFERDGYLYLLDPVTGETEQLNITIKGDFPWAETMWEDVTEKVTSASLSPTGKRAIMEARGEIFTIPVEHGDARNITQSSGAADRAPIWSPEGDQIAWFSDANGKGYELMIAPQDGLSKPRSISIGESKMAWEPIWSPDGKYIAFVDDDVRIKVLEIESEYIQTLDAGGTNLERGSVGPAWSSDSKWLAYSKAGTNGFRSIKLWSQIDNKIQTITNSFADAFSPSWDMDGRHLYFLASTDLALGSGWANTSSMTSRPEYAAYVINLRKDDPSPFKPRSDEETIEEDKTSENDKDKSEDKKNEKDAKKTEPVRIDFTNIDRRTMALPLPSRNYHFTLAGSAGFIFIGEEKPNGDDLTIQKYDLEKRESEEFISNASQVSVSANGQQMLAKINGEWKVMDATKPNDKDGKSLKVNLQMKLDRTKEWKQIFEEAWRYEHDYFYDPNLHGRDWDKVHDRYSPLIPFVKHRTDLTYILDQMNGELSVGHSFVFGGDYPKTKKSAIGLLGADLDADKGSWKIKRIYTTESWNPKLSSPLDRPDIKVQEGYYIVGINGKKLTDSQDPYQALDGTAEHLTVLHINEKPEFEGAWKEIVVPIKSENALRQRAWVEDNRRRVDKLSNDKLGYIWVPNTGGPGFVSFNRYFFAQQDKQGAVIDERFNGGGLLDDYMVDLMTRSLRAAITNEVPDGKPMSLPAGLLGPKVLLINELAGSGGDFFPWVFRQQKVGPLIGTRTWGGLVKSSVHYLLVDGGGLTAPDNAVFDPTNNKWVAENEGVAPDIEVFQDARSLTKGVDPQLERAVKEAVLLIGETKEKKIIHPPFLTPAKKKE